MQGTAPSPTEPWKVRPAPHPQWNNYSKGSDKKTPLPRRTTFGLGSLRRFVAYLC